jgi:DNA-binding transcriptional ArsR family regulator
MTTLDRIGFALAHPVRATIVSELLSGRYMPSSELAKIAGSAPSTTSEHLAILVSAGIVRVFVLGRHRYYTLASDEVARSLEVFSTLAQAPKPRTLTASDRYARVRAARVCWDHIAGELGTRLRRALIDGSFIEDHGDDAIAMERGIVLLRELGVDDVATGSVCGGCVDLTERRLHLRGAFAKGLLRGAQASGWIERGRGRELRVTPQGERAFRERLGLLTPV